MLTKKDIEHLVEVFVTKDDFNNEIKKLATKRSVNEVLSIQAEILKEIKDLKTEKTVGDTQDSRRRTVLEIHNTALKREKILSDQENLQIDQLGAF